MDDHAGLTPLPRRASMRAMRRSLRTLAAVLAGLALVAALPAPCGCAPESARPQQAEAHACCAPPTGVRAVEHGCCGEAPATAQAIPSPVGPDAVAPLATLLVAAAQPSAHRTTARPAFVGAFSPPPTVLRI
jgi:hypothetical protein